MSITVDLSAKKVAALKQITRLASDNDAVEKAAREFLRLSGLRELKAASGKVDFQDRSEELERLELGEVGFPA